MSVYTLRYPSRRPHFLSAHRPWRRTNAVFSLSSKNTPPSQTLNSLFPTLRNKSSHAQPTSWGKKVDCKAQKERQLRVSTLVFDRHEGGATTTGWACSISSCSYVTILRLTELLLWNNRFGRARILLCATTYSLVGFVRIEWMSPRYLG